MRRLAGRERFDRLQVERVVSEHPLDESAGVGRLDVLAEGEWESMGKRDRWTLLIEAKVDAREGDGQLDKYDEWLDSHAGHRATYCVFLTPDGREPETGGEQWESLSFLELVRIFRGVYGELRQAPGYHFLKFYLAGVLQDICGFPRNVGCDAADPYALALYLKAVHDSR